MNNKIQLYSLATPNGQKVSIALEEMKIEYDAHLIDITKGDQFSADFIKINPNSKIPAIVDPQGDSGKPLAIMESGAILIYLAEKSGKFLPKDYVAKTKCLQWLFWQVGGLGPMFGQFGHFSVFAKTPLDLSYGIERYTKEVLRLLNVLEAQLSNNNYLSGADLTIADFATMPWVVCLDKVYKASDKLALGTFKNINRWLTDLLSRPALQKGMVVCSKQ